MPMTRSLGRSLLIVGLVLAGCVVSFEDYPVGTSDGGTAATGGSTLDGSAGAGGNAGVGGAGGSGGNGGSTDGSAGSSSCAAGESCVPVPTDWTPIVLGDGACVGPFGTSLGQVHEGLNAPNECDPCTCQHACSVAVQAHSLDDCDGVAIFGPTMMDGTTPCDWTGSFAANSVELTQVSSCSVATPAAPKPASWTTSKLLCGAVFTPCNGGTCLPDAPLACIYQSGAHACPAGFPKGFTYYSSVDDDRQCASCSCAIGNASCTNVGVTLHGNGSCSSSLVTCPGSGCCNLPVNVNQNVGSAAISVTKTGMCSPSGGAYLNGTANPGGVTTVCCP